MDNKALERRLKSIENNTNLILSEREIHEDILLQISKLTGRISTLEEETKLLRERVDKGNKIVSADASDLKDTVNEIKDIIIS